MQITFTAQSKTGGRGWFTIKQAGEFTYTAWERGDGRGWYCNARDAIGAPVEITASSAAALQAKLVDFFTANPVDKDVSIKAFLSELPNGDTGPNHPSIPPLTGMLAEMFEGRGERAAARSAAIDTAK